MRIEQISVCNSSSSGTMTEIKKRKDISLQDLLSTLGVRLLIESMAHLRELYRPDAQTNKGTYLSDGHHGPVVEWPDP